CTRRARLCPAHQFFFFRFRLPPSSTLFPYTTLFRSRHPLSARGRLQFRVCQPAHLLCRRFRIRPGRGDRHFDQPPACTRPGRARSEEHTSELQSRENLVCRLLLEKKKIQRTLWLITT